jgi:hypothetical protein
MIQPTNLLISTTLSLIFFINLYVFEFVYDEIINKNLRFQKWKLSWSTFFRLFLTAAFIAIIFTVIFHRQYSQTTTITNFESWLAALDVAWTYLVLVFPIAFLIVFIITYVVTLCVVIIQIVFLNGVLKVSPELAEKGEYYTTWTLLTLPFIKAPKGRFFVVSWLFPRFSFSCGSAFLLGWIFLDMFVASLIAYPITYWALNTLFVDTTDLQMTLFGTFDPNIGWQYTNAFRFTLLSNHIAATANWLMQQPVITSMLGFLGLIATAIGSLVAIKKAIEELRGKAGKPEK